MIWESRFWKEPLVDTAHLLRASDAVSDDDWTEEYGARIEREIFLGVYAVRKLFDAPGKVTDKTRAHRCKLLRFDKLPNAPIVDWYNQGEYFDLFDLDRPHKDQRDLTYVANLLIHSFIMSFGAYMDNGPGGMFFCSDRTKDRCLYFIEFSEVAMAFELVGTDYPTKLETARDPDTGEMRYISVK